MDEFIQQLEEARRQALWRAFQRGVEKGLYENTEESRQAFADGWWATIEFERDRRVERAAGTNTNMLSFLLLAFGLTALAIPLMAFMASPFGAINVNRCLMIVAVGAAMLLGALPLRRCSKKQALTGREIFSRKWQCEPE